MVSVSLDREYIDQYTELMRISLFIGGTVNSVDANKKNILHVKLNWLAGGGGRGSKDTFYC